MEKKVIVVHDEKGKAVRAITEKAEEKKPDLKVVPKDAEVKEKAPEKDKPKDTKPATITFKR
ncbi:MAG: hypothetical protein FJ240_12405, partial [Nitrospira sp.]|nr:hypothetical protein [Nitrospira sp.]